MEQLKPELSLEEAIEALERKELHFLDIGTGMQLIGTYEDHIHIYQLDYKDFKYKECLIIKSRTTY